MLTVPLYSLLIGYLVFLAFFTILMTINFYHIIISGSFTFTTFIISFFCIVLTLLTLYFTFIQLQNVAWNTPITVFNLEWFTPGSSSNPGTSF